MENAIIHMTVHFEGVLEDLKNDLDACHKTAKMLSGIFVGSDGSTDHSVAIIRDKCIDVFVDVSNVDQQSTIDHLGEL